MLSSIPTSVRKPTSTSAETSTLSSYTSSTTSDSLALSTSQMYITSKHSTIVSSPGTSNTRDISLHSSANPPPTLDFNSLPPDSKIQHMFAEFGKIQEINIRFFNSIMDRLERLEQNTQLRTPQSANTISPPPGFEIVTTSSTPSHDHHAQGAHHSQHE